jgi:hypothetical protein
MIRETSKNKLKNHSIYKLFTVRKNCSSDLKIFANFQPSVSNFKSFSRPLEHFPLIVGQNNFGYKIPFLKEHLCSYATKHRPLEYWVFTKQTNIFNRNNNDYSSERILLCSTHYPRTTPNLQLHKKFGTLVGGNSDKLVPLLFFKGIIDANINRKG